MSQNYIRQLALYIEAIGRTYDAGQYSIRVRFSIKQSNTQIPNTATIRLTNQNRDLAKALCQPSAEGTYVSITAGYVGNSGLLFQGHIVRTIYGRENPTDTLTQILCSDGDQGHNVAQVNKTLPPGSTPQTIVNTAMQALQPYALTLGFIGQTVDLSTPTYPRSIALFGMAYKALKDVAKSKRAEVSTQNLQVQILKTADYIPGGAFELNSLTGLIGMPTLTMDGVYARTLINPQMKVNGLVHIDQSLIQGFLPPLGPDGQPLYGYEDGSAIMPSIAADGIYRIVKIDVDGDTRGQPWYMDLLCIKPGESTAATRNALGRF